MESRAKKEKIAIERRFLVVNNYAITYLLEV